MPSFNLDDAGLSSLSAFILKLPKPGGKALPGVPDKIAEGALLFVRNNCGACHAVGGVGGTWAPELAGVALRHDVDWIYEHFKDPKALTLGTMMPSYSHLSGDELRALTDYMLSLD